MPVKESQIQSTHGHGRSMPAHFWGFLPQSIDKQVSLGVCLHVSALMVYHTCRQTSREINSNNKKQFTFDRLPWISLPSVFGFICSLIMT